MYASGLWQSWDMFAPNPAGTDIWCDAEVVFDDGSTKRHQYPRIYKLSLVSKFFKERYRKFYERVNQDSNSWLWPPFAQRIALEEYEPGKPIPVTVRLWRHFYAAPKFMTFPEYLTNLRDAASKGKLSFDVVFPPQPEGLDKYSDYMFYEYQVDTDALYKAAAE